MAGDRQAPHLAAAERDPLLSLALQRIDLLVRRAALEQRLLGMDPHDPYRGLLLSDEEVDHLLQVLPGVEQLEGAHPVLRTLDGQLSELKDQLECADVPPHSRLGRLLARLELTPLDRDILLLALLPEVDPRYSRLLAFLQDDVTRSRPGVFLALRLLCPHEQPQLLDRSSFLPAAPLRRHRLVFLEGHASDPTPALLQQAIRVDPRIVSYLLDADSSDEGPFHFLQRVTPGRALADLLLPDEVRESLKALLPGVRDGAIGLVLMEGAPGSGRCTAARALAAELGRPLLEMQTQLEGVPGPPLSEWARLSFRETCLQGGILFCRERVEGELDLGTWGALAAEYRTPALLAAERFASAERAPLRVARLSFPLPDAPLRERLWQEMLSGWPLEDVHAADLAGRFRLNGGQIHDAVVWAEGIARRKGRPAITVKDIEEAIAFVCLPTLDGLARPILPRHTWDELILPTDVLTHLREFAAAIRRREQVYDRWGFDRRRPMGRGLNALFAGPSGTGKTMAAEIIAAELGLPVFKIDLSAVVSKYIGETEKHLRRLFDEAEQANAILFFDEADALFGKRSEVRDAHDRYANIEVAYLLQSLEEHAGVTILATNLYGNLDDAFVRRMHFIVHFPFPEEEYRRRIWEVIFPAQAPLDNDVDLPDLAHRFRLTGGHIRNIALGAAFLAADDGEMIEMKHLLRAARREFQKMGKVVDEADFALPQDVGQE